jgi:hypothetical protein
MYPFSKTSSPKTTFPILTEASEHFDTPNTAGNLRTSPIEAVIAFLFKRSAKHLRAHLSQAHGLELSHGQALDAVSAGVGCADWNTANAHLQQIARDDQGGLGLARAQGEASSQLQGPWRQGPLRNLLDFNVSAAIVGAAGTGKSVGLLFALQANPAATLGRPVMVIHGYESERYQPNWSGLLRHIPKVRPWGPAAQAAVPSSTDIVEVEALSFPTDAHGMAADVDARRRALATGLLDWLTQRAHLRPLLLVDEAYQAFGKHTREFVENLPAGVVVIWSTQAAEDFGMRVLASKFEVVHLLSAPRGPQAWNALGLGSDKERIERRMLGLPMGQAVSIPLPKQPAPVTDLRTSVAMPDDADQALRKRVLNAIVTALPALRFEFAGSPKHIRTSAWKSGARLHVLELHLRDRVLDQLSAEDQAIAARTRRAGAPVSGLTLLILDVLNSAGWLVRQVGATSLEPTEALWNICVGKMNYKGVLLLEIPGSWTSEVVADSTSVPFVTGGLFADPGEAGKRLRGLLRGPAA